MIPTGLVDVDVIIAIHNSEIVNNIAANKHTLFEIIFFDKKLNNGLNKKALVYVTAI